MSKSLLFFGAGRFSRICFESLIQNSDFKKLAVVVPSLKCELAGAASLYGRSCILAPPKKLTGWFPDEEPWDFGAVASFSYFIPPTLIDWFKLGIINAHPSLLPKYRGAAPIQRAIIDGADHGISIIGLDKKQFDAGEIYLSQPISIENTLPYLDVEEILAKASGESLGKVFSVWGNSSPIAQNGEITFAPKITIADARISFSNLASDEIIRRYMAIGHQENLRAILDDRVVHLLDISLDIKHLDSELAPGKCIYERSKLSRTIWIQCKDGGFVGVKRFRVEGKSSTYDAGAFNSGFKLSKSIFE